MRLSDLMASFDLATYPQISMLLFLGVFASVCWRVLASRDRWLEEHASTLPLEDDSPHPQTGRPVDGNTHEPGRSPR